MKIKSSLNFIEVFLSLKNVFFFGLDVGCLQFFDVLRGHEGVSGVHGFLNSVVASLEDVDFVEDLVFVPFVEVFEGDWNILSVFASVFCYLILKWYIMMKSKRWRFLGQKSIPLKTLPRLICGHRPYRYPIVRPVHIQNIASFISLMPYSRSPFADSFYHFSSRILFRTDNHDIEVSAAACGRPLELYFALHGYK